jgi:hypothetical protein
MDGERMQFDTGAIRSAQVAGTEREARYDLISHVGLRRLAETYGAGAVKYSPNNWRRGIPVSNLLNHVIAHIYAYIGGDRTEDHLAHAGWGLFAAMEFEQTRPELVDVPFDLSREAPAAVVGEL